MPKYDASWFPTFTVSEVSPESMPEAEWKRRFTTLDLCAHNGTHVETSDHAFRDGRTICQYDLARFAGVPTILDCSTVPDSTEIPADLVTARLTQAAGRPSARSLPDSHPREVPTMTKRLPVFAVAVLLAGCRRGVGASADAESPRRGQSHGCAARRQQPEDRNAKPGHRRQPCRTPMRRTR